jgi:hypothetical protein
MITIRCHGGGRGVFWLPVSAPHLFGGLVDSSTSNRARDQRYAISCRRLRYRNFRHSSPTATAPRHAKTLPRNSRGEESYKPAHNFNLSLWSQETDYTALHIRSRLIRPWC